MIETERKIHAFNALLDSETFESLAEFAQEAKCSKAAVVRDLIRLKAKMVSGQTPMCADGGSCRCPQAHPYLPQTRTIPPDPDRAQ